MMNLPQALNTQSNIITTIGATTSDCLSNYPSDILQIIFEEAVQPNREGFKIATAISHVCRRWRYAALSTPKLWTFIECSVVKNGEQMDAFWERMHTRSGSRPVYITLSHAGYFGSQLYRCTLNKFPKIKRLTFHLDNTISGFTEVQNISFASEDSVDELELTSSGWSQVLLDVILDKFPTVRHLHLSGRFFLSFPKNGRQTRKLVIRSMSTFPLDPILESFPYLEEFELSEFNDRPSAVPLPWENLKKLKLQRLGHNWLWLGVITCPKLSALDIDYCSDESKAIDFLAKHPSIITLRTTDWGNLNFLATAAPQLEHLTFSYCSVTAYYHVLVNRSLNGLPVLQSLTIRDLRATMGLAQFEMLVHSRCLPPRYSQSSATPSDKVLQRFTIQIPLHLMPSNTLWGSSKLFLEANCKLELDEDDECRNVCLSWI